VVGAGAPTSNVIAVGARTTNLDAAPTANLDAARTTNLDAARTTNVDAARTTSVIGELSFPYTVTDHAQHDSVGLVLEILKILLRKSVSSC